MSAKKTAGIKNPGVKTGKADPRKARMARVAEGAGGFGFNRTAGMLIDETQQTVPYQSGYKMEAYRQSYAFGLGDRAGNYDIPLYFVQMNQQNGGLLYWPVTLAEKYQWYRYWSRCIYLSDKDLGQVLMADGTLKSVKDVDVGDLVVTGLGTVRPAKGKFKRRCIEDKAVTLKAWCLQNHLKTTHHHPYWVLREDKVRYVRGRYKKDIKFEPEWVHAEHVKPGDYVLMPPMPSSDSTITPEQAKVLGYYVAEGSVLKEMRCKGTGLDGKGYKWGQEKVQMPVGVSFALNANEKDTVAQSVIKAVKRAFGLKARIARIRGGGMEVVVNGREVAEFCLKHGGEYSDKKRLSVHMLMASNEARRAFLLAYAEGDGHQGHNDKDNGQIIIGTSSPDLASQVQMLAISCGVMCRVGTYDRKEDSGYFSATKQIHITIPAWSADAMLRKQGSSRWADSESRGDKHCAFFINGYAAFRVKEVTFTQEDDLVYNIEVDAEGDEKSYICNGMVTHNTDAYIGRGLELMSDLPMSKLSLHMPKMKDRKLQQEIQEFFEYQLDVLGMFELLQAILWDMNCIGNVFLFHEWDDEKKMWTKAVMLPPEEVGVFQFPFSDKKRVEYRPSRLIEIIKSHGAAKGMSGKGEGDGLGKSALPDGGCLRDLDQDIADNIPDDLVQMVLDEGCIVMDSDPMTGSFVHQIARRKTPYLDLGVSVLERVLVPMLQKEHYRYTQLSLASRNMTPKNLITAPGLMPEEVEELRMQVDLSYMDPDYSIVTNYEVSWEQIGANDRLLDLTQEYERIESQVFAALGITRDLMTGEGGFAGNRVTVEILNTMFLLVREVLKNYIEKQLFLPICEKRGWYEERANGVKKYFYPHVGFNRLTIRDNHEVFESLFQLYQKGSLPVEIIYELFNLDTDEIDRKLKRELLTVKDSTFNRMIEEVASEVGRNLVDTTDVVGRVIKYLGLTPKSPEEEGETPDDMLGDDFAPEGESGEEPDEDAGPVPDIDDGEVTEMADSVLEKLPEKPTMEDVESRVRDVLEEGESQPAEKLPQVQVQDDAAEGDELPVVEVDKQPGTEKLPVVQVPESDESKLPPVKVEKSETTEVKLPPVQVKKDVEPLPGVEVKKDKLPPVKLGKAKLI